MLKGLDTIESLSVINMRKVKHTDLSPSQQHVQLPNLKKMNLKLDKKHDFKLVDHLLGLNHKIHELGIDYHHIRDSHDEFLAGLIKAVSLLTDVTFLNLDLNVPIPSAKLETELHKLAKLQKFGTIPYENRRDYKRIICHSNNHANTFIVGPPNSLVTYSPIKHTPLIHTLIKPAPAEHSSIEHAPKQHTAVVHPPKKPEPGRLRRIVKRITNMFRGGSNAKTSTENIPLQIVSHEKVSHERATNEETTHERVVEAVEENPLIKELKELNEKIASVKNNVDGKFEIHCVQSHS